MELKDAVLSTLAEIEDNYRAQVDKEQTNGSVAESVAEGMQAYEELQQNGNTESLEHFLVNLRERVLVLFEGLLSVEQSSGGDILLVEKKVDLIVNFLEYLLASIDEKLDHAQE